MPRGGRGAFALAGRPGGTDSPPAASRMMVEQADTPEDDPIMLAPASEPAAPRAAKPDPPVTRRVDDDRVEGDRVNDRRADDQPAPPPAAAGPIDAKAVTTCPFCAARRPRDGRLACPRCGLGDTPATRQSTARRLGPWFVYQSRNPAAPGMNWKTLAELVAGGSVTARSVVRGPTTGQMWRPADKVRGVSRLWGQCWKCAGPVAADADACPACRARQDLPEDVDRLLDPRSDPTPGVAKMPQTWLADAVKQPAPPRPARRFTLGRLVLALLLLIAIAAAALAAAFPERTADLWTTAPTQIADWLDEARTRIGV